MITVSTALATTLIILLLFFSTNMDRKYSPRLHAAGKHPFVRLLSGCAIVYAATIDPLVAMLLLLVVFFWIGDIHIMNL